MLLALCIVMLIGLVAILVGVVGAKIAFNDLMEHCVRACFANDILKRRVRELSGQTDLDREVTLPEEDRLRAAGYEPIPFPFRTAWRSPRTLACLSATEALVEMEGLLDGPVR